MMIASFLLAAHNQGDPVIAAIGTVLLVVVVIVLIIRESTASYNVVTKNGAPHCPRCNRQVTYRRDHCRSCGYQFKTYGAPPASISAQRSNQSEAVSILLRDASRLSEKFEEMRTNPPMNFWDQSRLDPSNLHRVRSAIQEALSERLMGSKKLDTDYLGNKVIVIRSRLRYSAEVIPYLDNERNGFDIFIPQHGLIIRITSLKTDAAPYDNLLENLCKIDRSIINGRKLKSQPLEFVPKQEPIPSLRVQVLQSKKHQSESQRQLPS